MHQPLMGKISKKSNFCRIFPEVNDQNPKFNYLSISEWFWHALVNWENISNFPFQLRASQSTLCVIDTVPICQHKAVWFLQAIHLNNTDKGADQVFICVYKNTQFFILLLQKSELYIPVLLICISQNWSTVFLWIDWFFFSVLITMMGPQKLLSFHMSLRTMAMVNLSFCLASLG